MSSQLHTTNAFSNYILKAAFMPRSSLNADSWKLKIHYCSQEPPSHVMTGKQKMKLLHVNESGMFRGFNSDCRLLVKAL